MSNNTTKVNNPMKVITGKDTRWSYANVWEAKSINGGAPKFSVSLIIPKSDTVTVQKIKAAIEAAYHEGEAKLKGNGKSVPALSVIKNPLRDGDTQRAVPIGMTVFSRQRKVLSAARLLWLMTATAAKRLRSDSRPVCISTVHRNTAAA